MNSVKVTFDNKIHLQVIALFQTLGQVERHSSGENHLLLRYSCRESHELAMFYDGYTIDGHRLSVTTIDRLNTSIESSRQSQYQKYVLNSCEKVGEAKREMAITEQSMERSISISQTPDTTLVTRNRQQDDFMTVINRYTENDGQFQQIIQDYQSIFKDKVNNRARQRHPLVQGDIQQSVIKTYERDIIQTLHRKHTSDEHNCPQTPLDIYWSNVQVLCVQVLLAWTVYHLATC